MKHVKLSLSEQELKAIRDDVLYATQIAIAMVREFCPYGQHMWP